MGGPHIRATGLRKVYPASPFANAGPVTLRAAFARGDARSLRDESKVAIDNMDLELRSGDRLGIIGRNGAGKSTLLAMLGGMLAPTSGSIEVTGQVTSVMTLGVGMREDLPGRENIYLDGQLQGKSRAEVDDAIDEIISFSELGEFIDYPVRTYSTGMKTRLAFAMIIHLDPEILIIDEALSAGDAFFSIKASAKIKEICEKGKIVIIVSHGLSSIVEMCNRCIWLDNGRVLEDGPPEQVTAMYVDAVRKQDEAQLTARFSSLMRTGHAGLGGSLGNLHVSSMAGGETKSIIYEGESCFVEFFVEWTEALAFPSLQLTIGRVDGVTVFETHIADESQGSNLFSAPGKRDVIASLGTLPLGSGAFEVAVQLNDGARPIAKAQTIIEVRLRRALVGGRPLLIHDASVSISKCS